MCKWCFNNSHSFQSYGYTVFMDKNKQFLNCLQSVDKLKKKKKLILFQFSLVAQSCPTLWDPMNCSMPGLPVHHQLPEFTQTHVHRIRDAIQPPHLLLSPSPPAPNPCSIRVFSNESTLRIRWPKYWSFSLSISPSNKVMSSSLWPYGLQHTWFLYPSKMG